MPAVWYRGRHWVLVFFRDRLPVGLNVPNGASESKEEYKDIKKLLAREFCEEVVILNDRPSRGKELTQRHFEEQHQYAQFISPVFAQKHANLREEHDGFTITTDHHARRQVGLLKTPFAVDVEFHSPGLEKSEQELFPNVVYSINPSELGIEVMALCTFDINEGEYIIDGEYDLSQEVLIRRIPFLQELSHLHEMYERRGRTLGTLLTTGDSADGKLLDEVPPEHCVVFDADIDLRKARREKIENALRKKSLHPRRKSVLEWEHANTIEEWLQKYEEAINKIETRRLSGGTQADKYLRTLCPVTWKTLELAFAHHLFQRLPNWGKRPTH